jgi:hypothetical protein
MDHHFRKDDANGTGYAAECPARRYSRGTLLAIEKLCTPW